MQCSISFLAKQVSLLDWLRTIAKDRTGFAGRFKPNYSCHNRGCSSSWTGHRLQHTRTLLGGRQSIHHSKGCYFNYLVFSFLPSACNVEVHGAEKFPDFKKGNNMPKVWS